MSFISASAIAGPSRIPYGQASRVVTTTVSAGAKRGYAERRRRRDGEEGSDASAAPKGGRRGGKPGEAPGSYAEWVYKVGYKFKRPDKGQAARWLGGEVPYASNPSFRPPPPLSNDLMNVLSSELRAGKRTIGQISQAYNVSKHRLDAIRKLKAVEDEFIRQNIPLQRAFQENMESLLRVESPIDVQTKGLSIEARRTEELNRLAHPSTTAELQEEHDAIDNPWQGAFGKSTVDTGMQRSVWEMQDEGTHIANTKADAEARAARKAAELAAIAAGRDADSLGKDAGPVLPTVVARAGKSTVFRFVDTSGAPAPQKAEKARK